MELFRSILQIAFPLLIALYALINIWQLKDLKWDIELERTIRQSQMEYLFEEIEKLRGKNNG
jgi:hypothetical protein